MDKLDSGIYLISSLITAEEYVGSSSSIERRWRQHINDLNINRHCNFKLQNHWNEYGLDGFKFEKLLICDLPNLVIYEQLIMDAFDCVKLGFNISPTAQSCLGRVCSEETRRKISEKQKGKTKNYTDEHKEFLASLLRGKPRPRTPEHQEKLNLSLKGKPRSEETKRKLRQANLGKKLSPETLEKMRVAREKFLAKKRSLKENNITPSP